MFKNHRDNGKRLQTDKETLSPMMSLIFIVMKTFKLFIVIKENLFLSFARKTR